jgi:hypothetical protein
MDQTLDTYRISDELSDYILSKNGFNYRITDPTLELLYQKFKTETIPSNPKKLYFKYSVSMPRRDDRNAIFEDFSTFPPITINFNGKPLTFKITNPTFSPQVPGPGGDILGKIEQTFDTGLFITKPGDVFSGDMYFGFIPPNPANVSNEGFWNYSDMVFSQFNFNSYHLGSDLKTKPIQQGSTFTATITEPFWSSNRTNFAIIGLDLTPFFQYYGTPGPDPETGTGFPSIAPPPPPPPTQLDVSVFFNPSPPNEIKLPDIFINGANKGNKDFVIPVSPGNNTVSFSDFDYDRIIYKTPENITVNVPEGTTVKAIGRYIGKYKPELYWLKEIQDIDKRKYIVDVTEGLFSNNIRNLKTFFTGSTSNSVSNYYTHIYDENPKISSTSSIQFSIAYGHSGGSGSFDEGGKINITPSKAVYGQYRNIILEKSEGKFNLTGTPTDSIYVINYQSKRLKDRIDAGVIEINIAHLSGSAYLSGGGTTATHTGSNVRLAGNNKVLRLIDDSKINTNPDYLNSGVFYNIVSGSIESGVYNSQFPKYYGKLFPSLGVVILDGNKLDLSASFATTKDSEINGQNAHKLFKSISGSGTLQDVSGDYLGMKARRLIREYNDYYFIRLHNKEFNYSNNTSFFTYNTLPETNENDLSLPLDPNSEEGKKLTKYLTEENGSIKEDFSVNPQVYITTIGLYNDSKELIAVGKLSKPIIKNFTDESVFTVRLKY